MKYRSSFLLSLSLHFLLLLCFIKITWPDNTTTGWKNAVIIHSYIYAPRQVTSTANQTQQSQEKNTDFRHTRSAIEAFRSRATASAKAKTKQPSANLNQGNTNPLLIALHNAIAEKEIYPDNAQALGEHGKVALHFLLHASGNITDITIKKSSGFALLDNAAMNALKSITPFTAIKEPKKLALTILISFK